MKAQVAKQEGEKKVLKRQKKSPRAPVRLWVKATFLGYRRSKVNQNESQTLLKVQGVNDTTAAKFYQGKRVAFVYKAHSLKNNSKFRAIWGRIAGQIGQNGVVVARFAKNLPPRAMGSTLRVFLYPQRTQTLAQ